MRYVQNVAPFRGTRVNVTSYTPAREVRHLPAPLVTRLTCTQQCCVQNCLTEFDTNTGMYVENVVGGEYTSGIHRTHI